VGEIPTPTNKRGKKMAHKQLKQVGTNRIYNYNKTLAMRKDMTPWPPVTKSQGLTPEPDTRIIDIEYDGVHYLVADKSATEFNALAMSHSDLVLENAELAKDLSGRPKKIEDKAPIVRENVEGKQPEAVESEQPETAETLSKAKRMEAIVSAITMMADSGDKNYFAANDMPKVQSISDICEFDITAKERDKAWKVYNKQK
jgi:hypothetical protein